MSLDSIGPHISHAGAHIVIYAEDEPVGEAVASALVPTSVTGTSTAHGKVLPPVVLTDPSIFCRELISRPRLASSPPTIAVVSCDKSTKELDTRAASSATAATPGPNNESSPTSSQVAEFAQMALAHGPNVVMLTGLRPDSPARNLWEAEALHSWQIVIVADGLSISQSERAQITKAIETARQWCRNSRGTITSLLRSGSLLYCPHNTSPWIPFHFSVPIGEEIHSHASPASVRVQHRPLAKVPDLMSWDFGGPDLDDHQLISCAFTIFQQILQQSDVEAANIGDDRLWAFLATVRSCYRYHIPYHRYAHAIDVLQASMMILVDLGVLNRISDMGFQYNPANSPNMSCVDALIILLAAYGHDMLHPGLTYRVLSPCHTGFSEKFNSLEEYHATFYLRVVERVWPEILNLRSDVAEIVRKSIVVTDMRKHQEFMAKTQPIIPTVLKAADISNAIRTNPACKRRFAADVWKELRLGAEAGKALSLPADPIVDLSLDPIASFSHSQRIFVSNMAVPYFKWIGESWPALKTYVQRAESSLLDWESLSSDTMHSILSIRNESKE